MEMGPFLSNFANLSRYEVFFTLFISLHLDQAFDERLMEIPIAFRNRRY